MSSSSTTTSSSSSTQTSLSSTAQPLSTPSITLSYSLLIHLPQNAIHNLSTQPSLLSTLPAPLTHALTLRRTNILAYTTNHKKTVYIFDLQSESVLIEIEVPDDVVGLFWVEQRLLIRCRANARLEKLYLFDLHQDKMVQLGNYEAYADPDESNIALNCVGISAHGALALRYITVGSVIYYENVSNKSRPSRIISCHKGKIQAIALSNDGKWMATCSDKGTLIRVWKMDEHNKEDKPVQVLRRGSYESQIYSLCFSRDAKFLIATSDSHTVHIFSIHREGEETKNTKSFLSWEKNEEKSFAWYYHQDKQVKKRAPSVATFADQNESAAWIVSEDGDILKIQFDPEKGGEAKKVFHRKVFASPSSQEMSV